eukprot:Gb_35914 [translate_table: standard]
MVHTMHLFCMQCTIIRTTELAAAREKFEQVQKCEKEISAMYSSPMLLSKLKEAAMKVDGKAESLHQKLLDGDIGLSDFIHKDGFVMDPSESAFHGDGKCPSKVKVYNIVAVSHDAMGFGDALHLVIKTSSRAWEEGSWWKEMIPETENLDIF